MKTGNEWLETLTSDDKIRFKYNFKKERGLRNYRTYMETSFDTFYKFIATAFIWSETKECKEINPNYWFSIAMSSNTQLE